MSLKRSGKIFRESENDHIFFSRLKCHCYPKPHQGGCCAIRGYQRFASPTELSCVERIIICLTDPTALLQQIFLSQTSDSRRYKALRRWKHYFSIFSSLWKGLPGPSGWTLRSLEYMCQYCEIQNIVEYNAYNNTD